MGQRENGRRAVKLGSRPNPNPCPGHMAPVQATAVHFDFCLPFNRSRSELPNQAAWGLPWGMEINIPLPCGERQLLLPLGRMRPLLACLLLPKQGLGCETSSLMEPHF